MYLCARGIDFASFYDISIGFSNNSYSVYFLLFISTVKRVCVDCISRDAEWIKLGNNCIVFENIMASIGDFMVAN